MCGPGSMLCSERAWRTRLLHSVSLLLTFVSDFRRHKMAHIPPVTTVIFQAGRIEKKLKIKDEKAEWIVSKPCSTSYLSLFFIG